MDHVPNQSPILLYPTSNAFISEDIGENAHTIQYSDNIIIHRSLVHELTNTHADMEHIHVVLTNTEDPSVRVYGTIGWPHYNDPETVYLPTWIMDKLGLNYPYLDQPQPQISLSVYEYPIPRATHIICKTIYSDKSIENLRNCIEESLHGFHIIEEKTLLYTNEGDFISIEKTEPSNIVRLGGEVSIDIQNPDSTETQSYTQDTQHNEETVDPPIAKTSEQRREEVRNSWLKRFK